MPKRKYSCIEDPVYSMSPCFQLNEDVELVDIPSTGEEYLLKVMVERQSCAVVTKTDKDYSRFAKRQTYFIEEPLKKKPAPDNMKPTLEWQMVQVEEFRKMRNHICEMRENESNLSKAIELEVTSYKGLKSFIQTSKPLLSQVFLMHEAHLEKILKIIIVDLSEMKPGNKLDSQIGQWIYAVLVCIREPLLSDAINSLRNLARACAEIRSHLDPKCESTAEAVRPLNMFICLVAQYFGQHDLVD